MATGEFDLIARHFSAVGAQRDDVTLGVGDDAALLSTDSTRRLGVAWSSLSVGAGEDPFAAGERCTESACRQLVREGGTPAWVTLAISMGDASDDWTAAFSAGVNRACTRHAARLVGGDTTAGPATAMATVFATGHLQDA